MEMKCRNIEGLEYMLKDPVDKNYGSNPTQNNSHFNNETINFFFFLLFSFFSFAFWLKQRHLSFPPDCKNFGCCGNMLTGELKIKVAHFQITFFFSLFLHKNNRHWQESSAGIFIINKPVVCWRITSQNLHVKQVSAHLVSMYFQTMKHCAISF